MTIRIVQKNILPPEKSPDFPRKKKRTWFRWYLLFVLLAVLYVAIASYFLITKYLAAKQPETIKVVEVPVQPDYPDLRKPLREALLDAARFVECDPVLANLRYDTAVAFSQKQNLDSADISAAQASLPKPVGLKASPNLELVSVRHDQPVFWVEVKVLDGSQKFIPNLGRVDFDVSQGGNRLHRVAVSQSILNGKLPRLALLLDSSGSISGTPHRLMIEAAQEFLRQLAPKTPVKIWAFSNQPRPLSNWTNDQRELLKATEQIAPDGGTALNDAVALAVTELAQMEGRSAIVLFTDGNDSFNRQPTDVILRQAKSANIPIHVVALKSGETKPAVLKQMADMTNGSFHLAENPTGLLQQFQLLADSLQTPVYRLAVTEQVDSGKPLKVVVSNRELLVDLTRAGN